MLHQINYMSISVGMKWVKYLLTDMHPYQVYGLLIIYMTLLWDAELTKPFILSLSLSLFSCQCLLCC